MILSTERGQSPLEVFLRNVGVKNGLSETASSTQISWRSNETEVEGFYLDQPHHNSSLQYLCLNGEPILGHEDNKIVNAAVRKVIRQKNKEVIIHNTIFVLLVTVKNASKFHQVIEECLNSFSRNCQVVQSFASQAVAANSPLPYFEEFDGITPLECTETADGSQQMCLANNELLNQILFTPCKSSGRIGAPALATGPSHLNNSHDISKGANEIIFHDDWDNPNFFLFNDADIPFPALHLKQNTAQVADIKLSRSDIIPESVICQVDNKYILSRSGSREGGELLLAWDQHAVHEVCV